ncbi:hypothetical protein ES708_00036 [subsurface metagenome]
MPTLTFYPDADPEVSSVDGDADRFQFPEVSWNNLAGGAWVLHDQIDYNGAQPANHPIVSIGGIPDVFGVQVSMRQTAGALRSIECEFYVAKILGTG